MSLARDITTVGSGTLISRLLAYLRDAWIAALLGAGPHSEALFVVLQIVNFFRRLLSEGALNGPSCRFGSSCAAAKMGRPTLHASRSAFCW
jgi:hypothetical protein